MNIPKLLKQWGPCSLKLFFCWGEEEHSLWNYLIVIFFFQFLLWMMHALKLQNWFHSTIDSWLYRSLRCLFQIEIDCNTRKATLSVHQKGDWSWKLESDASKMISRSRKLHIDIKYKMSEPYFWFYFINQHVNKERIPDVKFIWISSFANLTKQTSFE